MEQNEQAYIRSRQILAYLRNELNSEEERELVSWLDNDKENQRFFNKLLKEEGLQQELSFFDNTDKEKAWTKLKTKIAPVQVHPIQPYKWPRLIGAAALILITLSVGWYFNRFQQVQHDGISITLSDDLPPGSNKAILTLASGKTINLSDATNGDLANQAGIIITKTKDGQLVYTVKDRSPRKDGETLNTITTPKGGQYEVILPDGTRVWLNAASSLRYPTLFVKNERKVELTGEAYFEVAKVNIKLEASGTNTERRMPFIVKTEKQTVEVLGTHFVINSYLDEPSTKTTLLEGSVRVTYTSRHSELVSGSRTDNQNIILKPGQQSTLLDNNISIENVDTNDAIAWKEGYFMFNNESLESVMRKISRWYNVNIEFTDHDLAKKTIYGTISRYSNVSKVLNMLELTGKVKFDMENNIIKVSK